MADTELSLFILRNLFLAGPVVILKLRNRWEDISRPQESLQKQQQRNGGAEPSITNHLARVTPNRNRWRKLEPDAFLRRIRSPQSRAESRLSTNRRKGY